MVFIREKLDRLGEIDAFLLLHIAKNIAAQAAAKAMPCPQGRTYIKAPGLLLVERAQPDKRADTAGFKRHIGTDNVIQICCRAYFFNAFFGNITRHAAPSLCIFHISSAAFHTP